MNWIYELELTVYEKTIYEFRFQNIFSIYNLSVLLFDQNSQFYI